MIARTWRGWTAAGDADDYEAYLRETGLSAFAATPGNRGSFVLRRVSGDRAEFLVVSLWESLSAVKSSPATTSTRPSSTRPTIGSSSSAKPGSTISTCSTRPGRSTPPFAPDMPSPVARLRAYAEPRRQLILDSIGIGISAVAFGLVYGLAARTAGFSAIEASAMSLFVFGGAAQFAAVGYVAEGLAWPVIAVLTGFLNARHILYSAALAPWLSDRPRRERAVMAHLLTDEAFALTVSHFRRIGRRDAAASSGFQRSGRRSSHGTSRRSPGCCSAT